LPAATQPAARPASLPGRLAIQIASGGPIYVVNADGQGLRQVTYGLDPAWSPDGKRLAVARLEGEQRGVYVVNVDAGGEELLYGWSQLRWPAWSPDGGTLVFSRQIGGKEDRRICFPRYGCFTLPGTPYWRLGAVEVADRSFRDLPDDLISRSPAFKPDGSILYVGVRGLQTSTLSGNSSGLLRPESNASSPAVSPDGTRIVYMLRFNNRSDLYLTTADGANSVQLTRTSALEPRAAHNVAPAWSPDGRYIAFLSDRDGVWRLYIMNADGSDQRPFLAEALAGLTLHYDFADERSIAWGK
jgi:TolB protein